jgi:hypothetical protein
MQREWQTATKPLKKSISTVITSSSADSQVTVVVKYGNTTAAVSKSDGLAVLGFFFEVSGKSAVFWFV